MEKQYEFETPLAAWDLVTIKTEALSFLSNSTLSETRMVPQMKYSSNLAHLTSFIICRREIPRCIAIFGQNT